MDRWNFFMTWVTDLGNFIRDPFSWSRTLRRSVLVTLPISLPLLLVVYMVFAVFVNLLVIVEVCIFELICSFEEGWRRSGPGWRKIRGRY